MEKQTKEVVKTEQVITSKCGFACRKTYQGQKGFDKYYVHHKVVQYAKKIGEGDEDFVIKQKVVETKEDIAQLINSQASQVGVEAYMRNVVASGLQASDLTASVSEEVQDFSNAPETLADVADLGKKAQEAYEKLDPKLTKGLTLDQFLSGLSQELVDNYFKSLLPKKEEKTAINDVKKEGE